MSFHAKEQGCMYKVDTRLFTRMFQPYDLQCYKVVTTLFFCMGYSIRRQPLNFASSMQTSQFCFVSGVFEVASKTKHF